MLPGGHPDNFANEEYFGIVDINRQPRQVYGRLQAAFDPCSPRPPVRLSTTVANGRLQATIVAGASPLLPGNRLKSLTFTRLVNAVVEIAGQPSIVGPGPVSVQLPNGTAQTTCLLRRQTAANQARPR